MTNPEHPTNRGTPAPPSGRGRRRPRRRHLPPTHGAGPSGHPVVFMSHGFGAVKDQYLHSYAERFAAAGLVTVVYDHRGFGASTGAPRQDIDAWVQLRDMQHAISFARSLPDIDPEPSRSLGNQLLRRPRPGHGRHRLHGCAPWSPRSPPSVAAKPDDAVSHPTPCPPLWPLKSPTVKPSSPEHHQRPGPWSTTTRADPPSTPEKPLASSWTVQPAGPSPSSTP